MSLSEKDSFHLEFVRQREAREARRQSDLDSVLRDLVTDEGLLTHIRESEGENPHLPILWQPKYAPWEYKSDEIPALSLTADGGIQFHTKFAGSCGNGELK